MDTFEPKPPYGVGLWAKRRSLLTALAAVLTGLVFVYGWAVLTYLAFARGEYCPGNDPDPILACTPTFEQHGLAWTITNAGFVVGFVFCVWGLWAVTRRWRTR